MKKEVRIKGSAVRKRRGRLIHIGEVKKLELASPHLTHTRTIGITAGMPRTGKTALLLSLGCEQILAALEKYEENYKRIPNYRLFAGVVFFALDASVNDFQSAIHKLLGDEKYNKAVNLNLFHVIGCGDEDDFGEKNFEKFFSTPASLQEEIYKLFDNSNIHCALIVIDSFNDLCRGAFTTWCPRFKTQEFNEASKPQTVAMISHLKKIARNMDIAIEVTSESPKAGDNGKGSISGSNVILHKFHTARVLRRNSEGKRDPESRAIENYIKANNRERKMTTAMVYDKSRHNIDVDQEHFMLHLEYSPRVLIEDFEPSANTSIQEEERSKETLQIFCDLLENGDKVGKQKLEDELVKKLAISTREASKLANEFLTPLLKTSFKTTTVRGGRKLFEPTK